MNVTTHMGLRYTRLSMDDSRFGTEYDAVNLWQMPIGVAFSGAFETNGWTIAPTADISVVPAFGDKKADMTFFGMKDAVSIVDSNPVQATLGVSAKNGAWTFGVNYSLTASSDDRMNNSFNARASFAF